MQPKLTAGGLCGGLALRVARGRIPTGTPVVSMEAQAPSMSFGATTAEPGLRAPRLPFSCIWGSSKTGLRGRSPWPKHGKRCLEEDLLLKTLVSSLKPHILKRFST